MTWWRGAPGPLRLDFEEVHRHRPRSVLSPFVAHDETDPRAPADGEVRRLGTGPVAPFCAVLLDLGSDGVGPGLAAGLSGSTGSVLGRWDPARGEVRIEVTGPAGVTVAGTARAPGERPSQLAVVVQADRVTVLAATAGGELRPLLTARAPVAAALDLREPAVLAGLRYAWGGRVRRVRAGVCGPAGVRDPQVVRRPDGSPLVEDGRLHLTMTSAGLGFFQQAHWSVWALDLADPSRLEQVGAVFSARDGLLLGDHAGQLLVDRSTGRTTVLVSSWGDHDPARGVHVRHTTTTADLLRGVHVLPTERLDLPTTASAWDPSLARVGRRWYLAFTECVAFSPRYTFHPALAVTTGPDWTRGLRLVAADTVLEQTEGSLLQPVEGRWYVFASDGDARRHPVYDLRLRRLGHLSAPYGTNIPHPVVVRAGTGRRAPWWLLTFDGTAWHEDVLGYGTHGDFVVMAARSR
ncbi:hypothetical protein [Geodermatophilus sp. DSM 44513]|uniref:hypothetical protein n=1 Tax=Geodermatophilus sp. DSM 44513 TaxID=1528104 RepID=UPI00127341AB|nr:hypothetical protein [Geodermatophilus sp. DSM 44513]WNV74708.1 hypothetical protein RTG05_17185 [Geodermatophilus sp. DSM 44513]